MGESLENLVIKLECQSCRESHVLTVNTWTKKHTWKMKPNGTYPEKWALVSYYKSLKGYNKFTTWDQQYKGRALKTAGKIFKFFDMLEEPVGVAREMMLDVHNRAKREGDWNWNLETIRKLAPEWLAKKQGDKR